MLSGLDHVTIGVHDIDVAVRAYQRLLGAPPSWRGSHPALGTEGALFALPNAAIELVAPSAGAPEAEGLRATLEARGEGLLALAFCIADADAWVQAARQRGLRVTAPEPGEAHTPSGEVRHYRSVELSPRTTRGIRVYGVERPSLAGLRAPAPAEPAGAVVALDHVALRTADPDAASALYGRGLEIRLALDRALFGRRMLFFRTGGVTLEFVEDPSVGAEDVYYGLAFRVLDLGAAYARLAAEGFTLSDTMRAGTKPGTQVFTVKSGTCGVPILILRDPAREGAAPRDQR